jgi:hypothetical protein
MRSYLVAILSDFPSYYHVELCKEQFKEYFFNVIVYMERKMVLRMFFGRAERLKWREIL